MTPLPDRKWWLPTLFFAAAAVVAFLALCHAPPFPWNEAEGMLLDAGASLTATRHAEGSPVVIVELEGQTDLGSKALAAGMAAMSRAGARVIGLDPTLRHYIRPDTSFPLPERTVVGAGWVPLRWKGMGGRLKLDPAQLLPVPPQAPWITREQTGRALRPPGKLGGPFVVGHDHHLSRGLPLGRTHPLFLPVEGGLLPSFPLQMAIAFYGIDPRSVKIRERELVLGARRLTHSQGQVIVSPRAAPKAFPRFSLRKILETPSSLRALKGKAVLITSRRIYQPWVLSRNAWASGPLLTAGVLHAILKGPIYRRPPFLLWAELGALLVCLSLLTFSSRRLGERWTLLFFLLLIMLTGSATVVLQAKANLWVRAVCLISGIAIFYFLMVFKKLLFLDAALRRSGEAMWALGRDFERQGLLDLAFAQYRACPPDGRTLDSIRRLGRAYEQQGKKQKAQEAFEYVRACGGPQPAGPTTTTPEANAPSPFPEKGPTPAGGSEPVGNGTGSGDPLTVGRYKIVGRLGKGTMGRVYKGLDPRLNRPVAIKTIRFSDEFDPEQVVEIKERFLREAEIAGRLSHPAIVTIHDVGEDRDLTFMAMEFLDGHDLSHYAVKDKLLSLGVTVHVVARVAEALDYAHGEGVIHRDIKPANIMLLKNGEIKVTDFGIAKAISSSRTKTGVILGTPNYMSPEQIMGHRVDARTDIFSLGVLLFQLLTGKLPFHGDNLSKLLYAITQEKHPSLRALVPEVPRACEQIVDKALAKRPADRFESAGHMARYLRILHEKIEQATRGGKA